MEDNIDFDFSSIDHITSSLAAFSFQIIEKKEGFKSHDYEAPQIYADMTSYYNQMDFESSKQTDVSSTIHKLDHMYDHFMTSLKDNGEKPNIKNKNIYLGDPKSHSPIKKRSLSFDKRKEKKSNRQEKNKKVKIPEGKNGKKKEMDWEGRTEDEVSRSFSTDRYEYPKMDESWLYLPVYEGKPCPKNAEGKGWNGNGNGGNNYNYNFNNNNNDQYYYGQNQGQMNNFGWNYERNWGGYYPPYNFYNPAAAAGRFQPNGQNQLL